MNINDYYFFFHIVILVFFGLFNTHLAADDSLINEDYRLLNLANDFSFNEVNGKFKPGSHIKLFIPNLPYLAISHAINGSLVRPADNDKGYQYDVAISHKSIDDKVWEFKLRKDVKFQDGSPFNADSVVLNMKYFVKKPFVFSKFHTIFDYLEKVDDYTVRFYLKEPYGLFLHDANWLQFYTKEYLEEFGWNGKPNCPNLAEPGLYGLGPYILTEGYIEGDRHSKKVVLKANPDYWGENKAKVETITIYNDLGIEQATDMVINSESELDISSIAFSSSVDTVLSKYAKLTVSESKNNYAMHFNMINGHQAIKDSRIRYVINHSIDQDYLLNLSMLGEGIPSPTMVSPNFYKVDNAIKSLQGYFQNDAGQHNNSINNLIHLITDYQRENQLDTNKPLEITLLAQESYLFLLKDIKYFLSKVHIDLKLKIVATEAEVFGNLLSTYKNKNKTSWDLLLWGNYDWYKHPWTAFFVYRPFYAWSTIPENPKLLAYTDRLTTVNVESEGYSSLISEFIQFVYENNFMVFLPTPNNLFAVNKEVVFHAGESAFIYLRDIEVTDYHWSLRKEIKYPLNRQVPVKVDRHRFKRSVNERP
ncbi:MAG: ABC transporter substrate-binding protein [gamma proteobacterium symbiont of Taylorina sp.]|nr:ABC transporter substrate-binding protein [gamma proteobacterium symbiont of Taylorina sp.]